jgi:DNA-binding MarR family transcriptional regulator
VGVGPIEYLVLSRIAEARGRVALASLESEGRALRKDVPQAVARLERKGLVARVSRAAGNDAPGLQLTPSGRTTHKDAAAAVDAVSAEFEAILPAEDRETLGQIAELIASV